MCGIAAGTAWQVLNRRDLTSRLTVIASVVGVLVKLSVASGDALVWSDLLVDGVYYVGVLLALIFTEQCLRGRD